MSSAPGEGYYPCRLTGIPKFQNFLKIFHSFCKNPPYFSQITQKGVIFFFLVFATCPTLMEVKRGSLTSKQHTLYPFMSKYPPRVCVILFHHFHDEMTAIVKNILMNKSLYSGEELCKTQMLSFPIYPPLIKTTNLFFQ
eukprot:TCONS_00054683-protein